MGIFDEILSKATAEDKAALERYPELKKSLAELEEIKPKYQQASDLNSTWQQWRDAHWDDSQQKTKQQIDLERQLKESQDRAALLEQLNGGEMTFEEIEQQIKAKGYAPLSEIEKKLDERVKGFVDRDTVRTEVGNALAGAQMSYAKAEELAHKFEQEFGKPMDRSAFLDYAWKRGPQKLADFDDSYATFVSQEREQKRTAEFKAREEDFAKKTEEARLAGIEEGKRQAAMSRTGRSTTDQGAPSEMGHLEMRKREALKPKEGDQPDIMKVPLGEGAGLIYEEYLRDQANKGSVQ